MMMQEHNAQGRPVICMITTQSHLNFVRCFIESFLRHHPDGIGYVLHVDGTSHAHEFQYPNVTSIGISELRIQELPSMFARYDTFEMCNALKPFLLQYLLAHTNHQKICYFDSDIFIFGPL